VRGLPIPQADLDGPYGGMALPVLTHKSRRIRDHATAPLQEDAGVVGRLVGLQCGYQLDPSGLETLDLVDPEALGHEVIERLSE
jgi:hypothetical protein